MGDGRFSSGIFGVNKPMKIFDSIQKYVTKLVKDINTIVITGDYSWGRNFEKCKMDLKFIEELPGRKILLRGNHDMFWDSKKIAKLNDSFEGSI